MRPTGSNRRQVPTTGAAPAAALATGAAHTRAAHARIARQPPKPMMAAGFGLPRDAGGVDPAGDIAVPGGPPPEPQGLHGVVDTARATLAQIRRSAAAMRAA